MDRPRIARIFRRTPGEMAFDRCFFPLAALFVLGVGFVAITALFSRPAPIRGGESDLGSNVPVSVWPLFAVGLVSACFWLRGLVSVARVWRDPSARVLRFAALGLLVPLAYIAVRLLLVPFR